MGRDKGGACPFKLEFPRGTPPSLIVAGRGGASGDRCGVTYKVVAYFCADLSFTILDE